jgi:hypothetical protein
MSFFLRRLSVPLFLILSALSPAAGATGAAPGASFAETLYPFFQHERCLACHQFNSKRSNGLSYTSHRNRYLCDTCHLPQLTGSRGASGRRPCRAWTGRASIRAIPARSSSATQVLAMPGSDCGRICSRMAVSIGPWIRA